VPVDGCVLGGVFGTLDGDERGLEILPAYGNDEEALALSVDEGDPAAPVVLVARDPDAPGQRWWRRQVGDSFQLVHQATGKVARYTGQGSPVQLAAVGPEDPAGRWRSTTENGLVRLRPVSDPMGGLTPRDGWVAGTPVVGTNAMLGQGTMFTLTGGDRRLSSLGLWLAPGGSYVGSRARRPLAASVDPVPVAMTQNYLGFRWHFRSEHERASWLAEHDLTEGEDTDVWTRVGLPTGGLFAEAVLGESNSAERLDLTRFWDWQDSPIPFGPGAIAPPSTGTRAAAMDLTPPDVGASAAVLPAVQAAPDPASTAALVSALTARDLISPQMTVGSASPSKAGAVLNAAMDLDAKRVALATELAKAKAEKEKAEKEKAGTEKAGTGKAGTTDSTATEGHGERPEGQGERPEGQGERPEGRGELPEGETTGTGTWAVLPDTADTAVATELRAVLTMIGGRAVSPEEEERKHGD